MKSILTIITLVIAVLMSIMLFSGCSYKTDMIDSTDTQGGEDGDVMYSQKTAELEVGAIYRISVIDAEYENASITAENFAMTDNSMLKVKTYTKDLSQMWRVCLNDDGTYSLENMATLMKMTLHSLRADNSLSIVS